MLGIGAVDWLVIVAYLLGITALGVWAMRRVHSSASFFIGDRKFGKLMMIAFSFGAGTSSDQAVTVSAKAYQMGAPGIWYQWLYLFAVLYATTFWSFPREFSSLTASSS